MRQIGVGALLQHVQIEMAEALGLGRRRLGGDVADFDDVEIDHLVAIHFDSSYLLLNPHALGESSQLERLSLQREALILTRRELATSLATAQRASADVFIDAQLIELDTLAALLE